MKKILGILILGLLWCNVGFASEAGVIREPGNNTKCLYVFEKENIFKKEFLPNVNKKKGAFVTYIGCNKYYDNWGWWNSFNSDIDVAHQKAYQGCVDQQMKKYNLTGCHLFSIDDVIVWGKDAAFVTEVENKLKTKLAKVNSKKKKASGSFVYEFLLWDDKVFTKKSPTTFKKLTFNKEENISKVMKKVQRSSTKKKKTFKSFSFIAEYENNITIELFIEQDKDKKDFEKAEQEALLFAIMYGQMPNFLKTYNKKIYVHNDVEFDDGLGTWWVMYQKKEFHINSPKINKKQACAKIGRYSNCAVVMAHELAHVIQQLTGVISPSKWKKAIKLDKKKYCSKYAKKNSREDFAESITCWIAARYKSDKIKKGDLAKINEFIPNRLKFFDEMNFNMYPL
tara:strand:- start:492 stop:1679 length:1188 start_codon:yes stop_codon:yes gene_type:complete